MIGNSKFRAAALLTVLMSSSGAALAVPYTVSLDVSALGGSTFAVAVDLIDGGEPSNSVILTDWVSDGALGAAFATSGVSGILPNDVTLTDAEFFNEYLQFISGANTLSFSLLATDNAPDAGSAPDGLAIYLLDELGLPLFDTSDPTGASALFALDFTDALGGSPMGFAAVEGAPPVTLTFGRLPPAQIPEPSSIVLMAAGLLAAGGVGRRHDRRGTTA